VALQQIRKPVPRLPEEYCRYQPLIDKMMAKKREDRISSGSQLIQLVDSVMINPVSYTYQPE